MCQHNVFLDIHIKILDSHNTQGYHNVTIVFIYESKVPNS